MGASLVDSDTRALDELIVAGHSGLVVPPEDPVVVTAAIRRALVDDCRVDAGVPWNDPHVAPRFGTVVVNRQIIDACERALIAQRRGSCGLISRSADMKRLAR